MQKNDPGGPSVAGQKQQRVMNELQMDENYTTYKRQEKTPGVDLVTASVTFTHGAIGKWRANRPASSNRTTKSVRQLFSSVQGNAIFLIAPLQHSWNVNFFLSAGGKSVKSDAFPDENGFSRGST